ncbi:hypothetical protein DFJ74DRAFT_343131 [Hyaloraphidium curvatum]|nr:hypothetical protein DFJ74DRAFT_343131 [Hyaloraphidium curvatum]
MLVPRSLTTSSPGFLSTSRTTAPSATAVKVSPSTVREVDWSLASDSSDTDVNPRSSRVIPSALANAREKAALPIWKQNCRRSLLIASTLATNERKSSSPKPRIGMPSSRNSSLTSQGPRSRLSRVRGEQSAIAGKGVGPSREPEMANVLSLGSLRRIALHTVGLQSALCAWRCSMVPSEQRTLFQRRPPASKWLSARTERVRSPFCPERTLLRRSSAESSVPGSRITSTRFSMRPA